MQRRQREDAAAAMAVRACLSQRLSCAYAGARLQSLVFKKYVLGLGWHIATRPDGSVEAKSGSALPPRAAAQACCEAVLCQLDSLVDCLEVRAAEWKSRFSDICRAMTWLLAAVPCAYPHFQVLATCFPHVHASQAEVIEAEDNFEQACRHGLSHGKLLSLRYLIPDIPWHAMQSATESAARLKAWMQRLISLALRAASSALQPLSTPQETGLGMCTALICNCNCSRCVHT